MTGCTKVSAGCKNCYAEKVANRFWGDRKFTDVRTHADRLDAPLRWRKPRRVFVNSMSDLFHDDVPDAFLDEVFLTMMRASPSVVQLCGDGNRSPTLCRPTEGLHCKDPGVACFVKQMGAVPTITTGRGTTTLERFRDEHRQFSMWPLGKTRFGNPTGDPSLNGRVVHLIDRKGGDPEEWPEDLRVREMP